MLYVQNCIIAQSTMRIHSYIRICSIERNINCKVVFFATSKKHLLFY